MLKKILIGLGVIIVAFVVVVATRPATFHVERSTTIQAPADVVFAVVNDFHRWGEWSPWDKLDPDMKKTFSGPPSGVGSSYQWTGNDKVGEGRMTITEATPVQRVGIKLEFMKPWEATNTVTFSLKPAAGGTTVFWSMDGNNNFMAKAFSLFMDMDKMIGGDFERGLAQLKTVAEKDAQKRAAEEAARKAAAEEAARKAAEEAAKAAAAAPPPPAPAPAKKKK
jgi:uncharacterized protein YndB with AHSA1/START domain